VGGIVTGDWSPVHDFSERNRVPCIFPITDLPVISKTDWYTLYYSKGMYQEGEATAKYLRRAKNLPEGSRVVQLYRRGTKGEATARGFRETWKRSRRERPRELVLDGEKALGKAWKEATGGPSPVVILAWVEEEDLGEIVRLWKGGVRPSRIFLSAGLLGDAIYSLPEPMRGETCIAYPYLLPQNGSKSRLVVTTWLKVRKIEMVDFEIQAKMYFLGWILPENLHMIRHLWYRDYLLDVLDMRWDENYAIAVYPALTFGPGQRYGSKSCYIVQLGPGDDPEIIPRSKRVIH
jgi:hypothetical protein